MHSNTGPPRPPRDRRGGLRLDPLVFLAQRSPSFRGLLTVRTRTLLLLVVLVGILGLLSSSLVACFAGLRWRAPPPKNATDVQRLQWAARIKLPIKNGSVAVCLAGGLRMFELTATHLAKHLFAQLPHPDVFMSAPLDENSHKALLLSVAARTCYANCDTRFPAPVQARFTLPTVLGNRRVKATDPQWRVRGVRFLAQEPLDESVPSGARALDAFGSPNGVQGLLQYFQLVEGCSELIGTQEKKQGFAYEWVVRTRPDTFWMGPFPGLESLPPEAYSYPAGSRWGGLNDRLAVARRGVAELGLQRLSVLPPLARWQPEKRYNSEKCLRQHLQFLDVPTHPIDAPFCTLTLRPYSFPPTAWGLPVFSLGTSAPVNGAKCRPCTPILVGQDAATLLDTLLPEAGLPWDPPRAEQVGYELCNASGAWEEGWETGFDQEEGHEAAALRVQLSQLTFRGCIVKLKRFLGSVGASYSGPQARMLCSVRRWGRVWQALARREFSLEAVVAALVATNPGRAYPLLIQGFPRLDAWDGERLPLPSPRELASCDPCTALVSVSGSNAAMGRKYGLILAMRAHRWELLKCGGAYNTQTCLFLQAKKRKLLTRSANS